MPFDVPEFLRIAGGKKRVLGLTQRLQKRHDDETVAYQMDEG